MGICLANEGRRSGSWNFTYIAHRREFLESQSARRVQRLTCVCFFLVKSHSWNPWT